MRFVLHFMNVFVLPSHFDQKDINAVFETDSVCFPGPGAVFVSVYRHGPLYLICSYPKHT